MRILAFDCAGAQCAAAILAEGRIVATRTLRAERGHAQLLIPLLAELLDEAGLGFGDIDRFAATTGPGSFTGIRVALAAAHGLALGTGKPIIGISIFEALAAMAAQSGRATPRLLAAIDSRRAELFVQMFDDAGSALGEAAMLAPDAVGAWAGPGPLALTGDAAHLVAPYLSDVAGIDWDSAVDPAIVARLAAERTAGPAPAPFYLRPPDAMPARRDTGAAAMISPAAHRPDRALQARPLDPAMCAVAAALHGVCGFHESWDARAFADLLAMPGTQGLLALEGDLPIGLILWRTAADEAEILTIGTLPDRRRRGAGRFLLEHAIAAIGAAGGRRLLLEVAIDNQPATALYGALGFVEAGRRPGYYRTTQGPADALILARDI